MNVFALLPLCRRPSPARQQIFAGLRECLRNARYLDNSIPRIRIRSLDVIPLPLSLPRCTTLKDITAALDPNAPLSLWTSLNPGNTLTNVLLSHLIAFYDTSTHKPLPFLPPITTWNPSSLATIHLHASPKLSHILKLARKNACRIQETQWSSIQFKHIHLQAPFCHLIHTPAIEGFSSGVATLIPRKFSPDSQIVVVPSFILSVPITVQHCTVEYVNVYLHPSKVQQLGQALLSHLKAPASLGTLALW